MRCVDCAFHGRTHTSRRPTDSASTQKRGTAGRGPPGWRRARFALALESIAERMLLLGVSASEAKESLYKWAGILLPESSIVLSRRGRAALAPSHPSAKSTKPVAGFAMGEALREKNLPGRSHCRSKLPPVELKNSLGLGTQSPPDEVLDAGLQEAVRRSVRAQGFLRTGMPHHRRVQTSKSDLDSRAANQSVHMRGSGTTHLRGPWLSCSSQDVGILLAQGLCALSSCLEAASKQWLCILSPRGCCCVVAASAIDIVFTGMRR